jgi:hypothetical protein
VYKVAHIFGLRAVNFINEEFKNIMISLSEYHFIGGVSDFCDYFVENILYM